MEQRPIVLLDIGNTHCRQALAVGDDIREVSCIPTDAFLESQARVGLLAALPEAPAAVACVVPEARRVCRESFPTRKMFFLSADTVDRPDFSSVDTSTIGADRVANAVAAVHTAGTPVVVADAGTALTTEAVDAAGRFRGGAIAPGRALLRRALSAYTAQLPYVPPGSSLPPPLGTNTADAIRAGVDRGFLAAFRHLVEAARCAIGAPDCPVLVTGGDAAFCLEHLSNRMSGLRAAPPNFTLWGLAIAARACFEMRE